MTTPRPEDSGLKAWGLPEPGELAAFAAAWFPEFAPVAGGTGLAAAETGAAAAAVPWAASATTAASAAAPVTAGWEGLAAGLQPSSLPPAYAPVVLSLEAAGARAGRVGGTADVTGGGAAGEAGFPRIISNPYLGSKSLEALRVDFPILRERIRGRDLVWLDNAATTQRPRQVIDRIRYYYEHENSNVHRGAHELAARSTDAYEAAREKIARFIGAPGPENIVFVRGTTEGINLAAQAYVRQYLRPGDEIILTLLEHHANIVPWQLIAEETGAVLRVAPIDKTGQIILSEYTRLFNHNTRFVSLTQVSNALGTITPAAEMTRIAHSRGVRVLVDGAQSAPHMPVNVAALDADFFVFSGHKIFGPTGIGVLYGKSEVLEAARPYQGGGNMIADVTFERTLYQKAPAKFEAGTGSIADAVGLGAALDYVSAIGMENIAAWEEELLRYAMAELARVPGLQLIGTAAAKAGVLSFVMDGYGLEEISRHLNDRGIAVRAGHHCAQPVLRSFGLEGTVRPSLAFYNTPEEIDNLVRALYELV
ncbi:MAG: cysteine desulfurase [Spirochaetaceae bacterium]|jgi:cysteine desulfurase/selenocysteine lyase|nr:cysteine desulfurase [Spirochaetaceae bacterium]